MEKNLCLVKMGGDYDEKVIDMQGSDVGNYRIRGTFHDKNGNLIFIEFGSGCKYDRRHKKIELISRIKLRIDHQFNASQDWDENKSHIKIDYQKLEAYNYTKKDILLYIKNQFGVKFDNLILIDTSICNYDYKKIAGDEFIPDTKAIEQAQKIKDYFYKFEKEKEGKRFPNFSIYYENDVLTVLKHYNGFNDKISIKNIYDFDFNYKIPLKNEAVNEKIGEYEIIKESDFAVAIYKNGKLITRTGTMYTAKQDILSGKIKKFEKLNGLEV